MNKLLTLNFFGEKVDVTIPETLESLRKKISEKFFFSPSDTAELILSYAKDVGKKIIQTEKDFREFIKHKILKIDLDIDQNSKIFKENMEQLKNEKEQDEKKLKELLAKEKEMKDKENAKKVEAKKKMDELKAEAKKIEKAKKEAMKKYNAQIKKYTDKINQIKKVLNDEKKEMKKQFVEMDKSINDIKTKLGIPIEPKVENKEKKIKKIKKDKKIKKKDTPLLKEIKNTIKGFANKFNNYIKLDVDEKDSPKKDFFTNVKKITDFIKNNTAQITNDLAKKYEDCKQFMIPIKKGDELTHWGYICDGCEMAPIKGIRYHCEQCKDFDFCEKCHKDKKEKHGHNFKKIEKPEVPVPKINLAGPRIVPNNSNPVIHSTVSCDGCGKFPIIGIRYKCAVCKNFDYCEKCEEKYSEEHKHPFIKIYKPTRISAIECVIGQNMPDYQKKQ